MLREDRENKNLTGNDRFEGFAVDLVKELSQQLGFNYVLKLSDDGHFGQQDGSGKWNGMIGELVDGTADLAAASLTITAKREQAIDFTHPFMNLGIAVLHKRGK